MKKVYRIPVTWSVYGIMEVEADSLEEAEELAISETPLPEENDYLDDSFSIDYESDLYGTIK